MAEMFTKSQTGYLDEYWGLDSSGNCCNLMLIHGHCHDQITAQMQRTHDKGSVTEEPCAGKLASTVLKQR